MAIIAGIGSKSTGSKDWIAIVGLIIFIGIVAGLIYISKLNTQYLEQRQREF